MKIIQGNGDKHKPDEFLNAHSCWDIHWFPVKDFRLHKEQDDGQSKNLNSFQGATPQVTQICYHTDGTPFLVTSVSV